VDERPEGFARPQIARSHALNGSHVLGKKKAWKTQKAL
jgi:hypothetical protein